MSDESRNLPTSPADGPAKAQTGPGRAGTEEEEAAKEGTPQRVSEGSQHSLATEAAAQSGDELADGARGKTDRG